MSERTRPNGSLIRRVLVASLMLGVSLIFLILGRAPGWQPFATGAGLAMLSLLLAVAALRGADWMGFLAFVIIVLGMFWKPGQPWAAVAAFILLMLNALKNARVERIESEAAAAREPAAVPDEHTPPTGDQR